MSRIIIRILRFCGWTMLTAAVASPVNAGPQTRVLPAPIAGQSGLVTLRGNTRPEANARNDRGPVADALMMNHMMLQLRRTPEQEKALQVFLSEIHDPKSPLFHHWITAAEFGKRYGVAPAGLATVTGWLRSQGFTVNLVYPNHMVIDFTGSVGQIRQAFHTEIHHLVVKGQAHIANMSDPQIPAALASTVAGIVSLNDFRPHPMFQRRAKFTTAGGYYAVVPADLATIYNFNPAFAAGFSGQGQTIVVVEDTDLYTTADWNTFRSVLGLASAYPLGSLTQVHPPPATTCTDPGVNGDDGEAAIDVEWASAAAPSATIELASCSDTATFGGFIALQNILNASNPPAIVSISYGESEPLNGAASNAAISSLYQQAVTAGVSVFVSSGDEGGASSDANQPYAVNGITVSAFTSTPYNVSVGGTDFADTYAGTNTTYWNATNASNYGSALSYVPELPWNDSCASVLLGDYLGVLPTYGSTGLCNNADTVTYGLLNTASGSGGPSGCATGAPSVPGVVSGTCAGYAKPSWQSGFVGIQSDGVRDIPDVSLFAANGIWGHYYVVCFSDLSNGGASCSGTPDTWSGFGGTSVSSPIWAGIQSLINQASGSRMGNPNPTYYSLAKTEYGASGNTSCYSSLGNGVANSCIFYDITQIPLLYTDTGSYGGDMDVPCSYYDSTHIYNCYDPGGTSSNGIYGVLSTSNSAYQPAFGSTIGWDFSSGIGTVNASNLVANFAPGAATLAPLGLAFPPQALNTSSAAQSVTLTNTGLGTLTLNSFMITGGNSSDFSVTETCSSTLGSGASCTLNPKFKPTAPGPRKTLLSISDNAGNSPQTVILTGVGTAANLSPPSLTFASQTVGTHSTPQTITLKNLSTTTTMHLWQIAIGGANAGDFSKTTTCGATLGPSTTCTVSVTFTPTQTGARSGSVLFSDDGGGSPQAVPLTGTGM